MKRWLLAALLMLVPASANAVITAQLNASRTSCVAPCFVRFDGIGSDSTATTNDFHDIDFRWNFGDSGSGTWARGAAALTSAPQSKNVDYGPLAAHVFDPDRYGESYDADCGLGANTCKRFQVSMTVTYNGETTNQTVTISVTKPDAQYASTTACINIAGDSDFGACPSAAAGDHLKIGDAGCADWDNCVVTFRNAGKKRILTKRGGTFASNNAVGSLTTGPGQIGAYGSGADPILNVAADSNGFGLAAKWTLSDLDIRGGSGTGSTNGVDMGADHQLVYRGSIRGFGAAIRPVDFTPASSAAVETAFGACNTNSGGCYSTMIGGGNQLTLMGIVATGDTNRHNIRIFEYSKLLVSHSDVGPSSNSGAVDNLLMNQANNQSSQYSAISDNFFKFGSGPTGVAIACGGEVGPVETVDFHDVIVERNFFTQTGADVTHILIQCADRATIRNNTFLFASGKYSKATSLSIPPDGDIGPKSNAWVYNNSIYSPSGFLWSPGDTNPINASAQWQNVTIKNNLFWTDKTSTTGFIECNANPCSVLNNMGRYSQSGVTVLTGNPFAVSSPSAPDDFKLSSVGAQPVNAGTALPSVSYDFWRGLRTGTLDVGAHEFGSTEPGLTDPLIGLSVTSISTSTPAGTLAADKTFTVRNAGAAGATLSYTISDDQNSPNWLTESPASGTSTGEADTITVSFPGSDALAVGTYVGTITVNGGVAGIQTILVTLTVTSTAPQISLSKAALNPTAVAGNNATGDSFTITNVGGGTLSYTVSDDQTWLSESPTTGTSTGEADTISVTYSTSGLSAGTYTATITVADAGAVNTPQTIPVTLTITPAAAQPAIGLSTTDIYVTVTRGSAVQGSVPATATYVVTNTGGGTLHWSSNGPAPWYNQTGKTGTLTAGASSPATQIVWSAAQLNLLAVGSYTDTITVGSSDSGVASRTITIHLTVSDPALAVITLSAASLTPTAYQTTSPANQTFTVSNTGSGTLSYTIADDAAWLSESPTSATSNGPDTITVSYSTAALAVGTHVAHITVSGATAADAVLTVTLTITDTPRRVNIATLLP